MTECVPLYIGNNCRTSQMGSVPWGHDLIETRDNVNEIEIAVNQAVEYSWKHEIPFLPELTRIKRLEEDEGNYIQRDNR